MGSVLTPSPLVTMVTEAPQVSRGLKVPPQPSETLTGATPQAPLLTGAVSSVQDALGVIIMVTGVIMWPQVRVRPSTSPPPCRPHRQTRDLFPVPARARVAQLVEAPAVRGEDRDVPPTLKASLEPPPVTEACHNPRRCLSDHHRQVTSPPRAPSSVRYSPPLLVILSFLHPGT